jgi:hypothetical protein
MRSDADVACLLVGERVRKLAEALEVEVEELLVRS